MREAEKNVQRLDEIVKRRSHLTAVHSALTDRVSWMCTRCSEQWIDFAKVRPVV